MSEVSGNVLIKGGTIVDGTGAPAYSADVRVADGRIVEIGADLTAGSEKVYDASGCYVTPGFVDTHTHYDAALFWDPSCDPIVQHGVTTILIGNCGLSLAPVRKDKVDSLVSLFSYIEDLPRDVFHSEIPWNWETYPEYAREMKSRKWGVNVVSLVSHSLLRTYEIGDEAWKRASTADEASRIAIAYSDAMAAGAFGVSTSRFDRSPAGDLVPSYYSDPTEFEALFEVSAKNGGIVQIIPDVSGLETLEKDLREMGSYSVRHGGVPVLSNGIYDRPDMPDYGQKLVQVGKDIQADGGNFYYLASPRSIELGINFNQCFNFIYVSAWNELVQPDVPDDEKKRRLADPEWRARARVDWDSVAEGFPSGGMERLFRITQVGKPEFEKYLALTFDYVLDLRPGHPSDQLADWVLENDLKAEFVYPFTNTDAAKVGDLLASEVSLISGSDAGAHISSFDGAGDVTLVLTRHVRERGDLTLESAVRKMTKDQTDLLGIKDRGEIRVGAYADLAVFDLQKLNWAPEKKVRDIPGGLPRFRRPEGGFRYTFINGVLAQENGELTGELPARFLDASDRVAA